MKTPPTIIDYVPDRQRPFFMRWCIRLWLATAGALGLELVNSLVGPNGNNVTFAAWTFFIGLICFVLGALTGGLNLRSNQ